MALRCRSHFAKHRRAVDALSVGAWGRELSRLRTRLSALMSRPGSARRRGAHPPRPAPLSGRGLQDFAAAGELMNDDDQDAIIRITEEVREKSTSEITITMCSMAIHGTIFFVIRDCEHTYGRSSPMVQKVHMS
jgi:hypothetical protein